MRGDDPMNKKNAYSHQYTEGEKYQESKNLTIKEITALVRKEIRVEFKGWKISVSKETYAGGASINVNIKDSPIKLYNSEYARLKQLEDHGSAVREYTDQAFKSYDITLDSLIYTDEGAVVLKRLKEIVEQYNFDDSDSMIDYFHVNYYSHVGVDWEAEDSLISQCVEKVSSLV